MVLPSIHIISYVTVTMSELALITALEQFERNSSISVITVTGEELPVSK